MKARNRLLRLSLIFCLVLGWTVSTPLGTPGVVRADTPLPPVEGQDPMLMPPPPAPPAPTDAQVELFAGAAALEQAQQQGPAAILALAQTLRGKALDLAMRDIVAAHRQLALAAPPRPATAAISPAEEETALQIQATRDAASRARALAHVEDQAEGQAQMPNPHTLTSPNPSMADRTVGSAPCTYATIAAALAAASPGDTLLIEGGVTFTETLLINESLTLRGGYNGCGSGSTSYTTIVGGGSGRVMEIYGGADVTLENLRITNGNSEWGGGIRASQDVDLYGTNLEIYNNTATVYGGGLRLWGARATFTNTNIYDNVAPLGAGVYGSPDNGIASTLDLPSSADVYSNNSLTGSGFGGGVYMNQGIITLTNSSDIYNNDAIEGGGTYLISSTLTIEGEYSEIMYNTATGNGGGIYALGSTINLDQDAELFYNTAGTDGTGSGGGAYLDKSNLMSDKGLIYYNTADDYGGGVYATNNSLLDMDLDNYACAGPRCSQLSYNTTSLYGGGVWIADSEIDLRQIFIENNTGTLGGGIYAANDPSASLRAVYLYNCLLAQNNGGAADGIRLLAGTGQTTRMVGRHNTLAYNPSTGDGVAIGLGGTGTLGLSLDNSIIWGHTTSINDAAQTVSYSDIQGGYTGTGNLDIDPQFVAPGSGNFHLQNLSPVIDRCATGESRDFDNESRPVTYIRPSTPYDMGADEASARVGINGAPCAYGRIQDAVDAASPGDTIQAAVDVFSETVDISKTLTIVGGYDTDCTTYITGTTTVNGGGAGSVFDITGGGVTLRNLNLTGGNAGNGGGLRMIGSSQVTLDNTDVYANQADNGGGAYILTNSVLTLTNDSDISNNVATSNGGGARVWGKLVGEGTLSDIEHNSAPNGGGVSVPGGTLVLHGSDMTGNQATAADGKGGGIHVYDSGVVTMTRNVWVYETHTAYDGAGIYADNAMLYLNEATIRDSVAANNGGGVYLANGSTLNASEVYVGDSASGAGNAATLGAGMYVLSSTVEFDGDIFNNIASNSGGGVYAVASTLYLTDAQVGGTGANEANRIGAGGLNGGGLYLTQGTHATLQNTVVSSNTLTNPGTGYGGGLYVRDSSVVTLTNSRVERHVLPSTTDGRGAGIYVYSSTVTLDNSAVLSNTAGTDGGGIRMFAGGTLNILNGSELRNNHAPSGDGGAVSARDGTLDINISDSTLQSNTASGNGGAIALSSGTLDFTGWWDVRNNTAGGNGGAVAVVGTGIANFRASGAGSSLIGNQATGNGGALYINNASTMQLHSVNGYLLSLSGNQADGNGGAAYADNGAYFDMYGRVVATANSAGGNGGVFYLTRGSRVLLDDYINDTPELRENSAQNGGAIYAQDSPNVRCDGAVLGSNADGNHATAGAGGALYLSGSIFNADNCTFRNSRATQHGGAIAAYTSTLNIFATYPPLAEVAQAVELERGLYSTTASAAKVCDPLIEQCSAFYGNVADSDSNSSGDGGAIYTNDSTLNVQYTYLYRNSARFGGGIYQTGASAAAEVANTLVYSNTSNSGGLHRNAGAFTLAHVTLANNLVGAGFAGTATVVTNTIAWGNTAGGFMIVPTLTSCNIDQSGNAGVNVDPQFMSPGAGENYRLSASSPAIDACATGLPLDLDNIARPIGDLFDMGAYEGAGAVYIYLPLVLRNHTD